MLDDVSWHEVYEQNDLDLAFTMFLEKMQISYDEAFPIVTIMKPKSIICGWFDAELRSLQKKKTLYAKTISNRNWHVTEFETTTKESLTQRNLNIDIFFSYFIVAKSNNKMGINTKTILYYF